MRFAIDRYSIGTESEVSADDFDGISYIPSRRNRFYCPECGKIVYFRSKGGSHPNHFFHQEKIDGAPECDRRVDGRSGLSLSERIGLPLYLTTLVLGEYHLNIGFPALGEELLKNAALYNYSVEIASDSRVRNVKINATNFIEDAITLVPIDFIPDYGNNFSITISGDRNLMGLRRKWSDYADGFDVGGAFFSDDGYGGKKVRRGGSISTHKSYYAVMKNKLPSFRNVQQEAVGKLKVGRAIFTVFRIQINVSLDEKEDFSSINSYLNRYFGIWLLECVPELIPIWPPVIQNDCFIPVSKNSSVLCAVSSKSATPNVFVYSESGVSNINVTKEYNICTVNVNVGTRPVTLSVDRKYVGREITFSSSASLPQSNYQYDIEIGDKSPVSWEEVDKNLLSSDFHVFTNSKMELFTGTKNKQFRKIAIREPQTLVPELKETEELYFVVGSRIVRRFNLIKPVITQFNIKDLASKIQESRNGSMVPIPRWAWCYIGSFKNINNDIYCALMLSTTNGKIYTGVLRLLRMLTVENNYLKAGERND